MHDGAYQEEGRLKGANDRARRKGYWHRIGNLSFFHLAQNLRVEQFVWFVLIWFVFEVAVPKLDDDDDVYYSKGRRPREDEDDDDDVYYSKG